MEDQSIYIFFMRDCGRGSQMPKHFIRNQKGYQEAQRVTKDSWRKKIMKKILNKRGITQQKLRDRKNIKIKDNIKTNDKGRMIDDKSGEMILNKEKISSQKVRSGEHRKTNGYIQEFLTLRRQVLTRHASYSQHGSDTTL